MNAWRKRMGVVALVGTGFAAIVNAQIDDPYHIEFTEVRDVEVDGRGEPGAYGDRALGATHDGLNGGTSTTRCALFLTSGGQPVVGLIEDISFVPGPWASTTNNLVQGFRASVSNQLTARADFDLRMRFWNPASVDFTRNPMIASGEVPLREVVFPVRGLGPGIFSFLVNLPAADQFVVPGNRVMFSAEALNPGTNEYFTGPQNVFWAYNPASFVVQRGSSTASMGVDRDRNMVFVGGATPTAGGEHTSFTLPSGNCAGQNAHYPMLIQGEIAANPPTNFQDLGSLTDASAVPFSISASGVKWLRFTLPTNVTDAGLRFLDLDTEGSAMADTDVALFDSNGSILNVDRSDGSGELAHLTFGVGRRAASAAGGRSFDGGDGELLGTGPYWLAVTSGPAAFGGGFVATNSGPGGSGMLHVTSNLISGALAASVAPAGEDLVADLGDVLAPGVLGTPTLPGAYGVIWYQFNVCQNVLPGGTDFFDLDFSDSDLLGDSVAFLFNSSGALVATSDDANPPMYLAPQFSFGPSGNPRPSPNPNAPVFDGQSGALLRGTYWLGVAFRPAGTLVAQNRWHIRTGSGNDLRLAANFYTTLSNCEQACVADVDDGTGTGTPDGGVTIDDLLYYLGIYSDGSVAADVDDGTGTGTRDGGVTIDDLLYYLVRYEAGC